MFMLSVLRITKADSDIIIFKEQKKASPFATRPLFLVLVKEVLGNLEDIKQASNKQATFTWAHFGKAVKVNLKADFMMWGGLWM